MVSKSDDDYDQELSDLLDNALLDFEDVTEKIPTSSNLNDHSTTASCSSKESAVKSEKHTDAQLTDAAKQMVNDYFEQQSKDSELSDILKDPNFDNFRACVAEAVQSMNEASQQGVSTEQLIDAFNEQAPVLPFMHGIMEKMLSKEVLYPCLKDISERFPQWMTEHEHELGENERDKYKAQMKLMQDICVVLDQERADESAHVKSERFERVLDMMQKLQDYGYPPKELVGEGEGLPFGDADPTMDAAVPDCKVS